MNQFHNENERLKVAIEMAYGLCRANGNHCEWSSERTPESVTVTLNVVFTSGKFNDGIDLKRGYSSALTQPYEKADPERYLDAAENAILTKMHRDAVRRAAKDMADTWERIRPKAATPSDNIATPT